MELTRKAAGLASENENLKRVMIYFGQSMSMLVWLLLSSYL